MKKYTAILTPGQDGYIVAECAELPGCISQGKTRAEALRNIKEAIQLYVECLREHPEFSKNGETLNHAEVVAVMA